MRNVFFSLAAVFAVFAFPGFAQANEASDQAGAIRLCRAEVAAQAGVDLDAVRLDQLQTRTRTVRVHLDLWRNGQLENVRCDVRRAGELQIAAITPALGALAAR